jgi:hypothetical protein
MGFGNLCKWCICQLFAQKFANASEKSAGESKIAFCYSPVVVVREHLQKDCPTTFKRPAF